VLAHARLHNGETAHRASLSDFILALATAPMCCEKFVHARMVRMLFLHARDLASVFFEQRSHTAVLTRIPSIHSVSIEKHRPAIHIAEYVLAAAIAHNTGGRFVVVHRARCHCGQRQPVLSVRPVDRGIYRLGHVMAFVGPRAHRSLSLRKLCRHSGDSGAIGEEPSESIDQKLLKTFHFFRYFFGST